MAIMDYFEMEHFLNKMSERISNVIVLKSVNKMNERYQTNGFENGNLYINGCLFKKYNKESKTRDCFFIGNNELNVIIDITINKVKYRNIEKENGIKCTTQDFGKELKIRLSQSIVSDLHSYISGQFIMVNCQNGTVHMQEVLGLCGDRII